MDSKVPEGLDLTKWKPDYRKTLEENEKDFREAYFKVYGEYPPTPDARQGLQDASPRRQGAGSA
ncbi:MAG: hypothetical protein ACM3ZU_08025 [Bacteroidota bacterium]